MSGDLFIKADTRDEKPCPGFLRDAGAIVANRYRHGSPIIGPTNIDFGIGPFARIIEQI